jgi:XRE family transcriptional regulator of biofilm formation
MMIGDIIKKNRLEKNLSLTKLADQAGVSKAYLFNLENNNQKNPSLEIAQRISKVLEIDPFVLLSEVQAKNEDVSETAPNQYEMFFELQKLIEDLHTNKLEDLKHFIEFTLWKREKTTRTIGNEYSMRLIDSK